MLNTVMAKSMARTVAMLLLICGLTTRCAFAQTSPDALFAAASPAVVKLTVEDEDYRQIGTASGFVIAFEETVGAGGRQFKSTVITNYHVIHPAVSIAVLSPTLEPGSAFQVTVVVEDPSADVAVLTVRSSRSPNQVLKFCEGAEPLIGTKRSTPPSQRLLRSDGLRPSRRDRPRGHRTGADSLDRPGDRQACTAWGQTPRDL